MKLKASVTAKLCVSIAIMFLNANSAFAIKIDQVWINEIHYDNISTDDGEFVEIAGIAGIDWELLSLQFYNGSNGELYKDFSLPSGKLENTADGYGFLSFDVGAIQNGAKDAIALIFDGAVLQFLSYEGVVTAVEGAASGLTSYDIGVSESNDTTPIGYSLQFMGVGKEGAWSGPAPESKNAKNVGQVLPKISSVPDFGATSPLLLLSFAALLVARRRSARP